MVRRMSVMVARARAGGTRGMASAVFPPLIRARGILIVIAVIMTAITRLVERCAQNLQAVRTIIVVLLNIVKIRVMMFVLILTGLLIV